MLALAAVYNRFLYIALTRSFQALYRVVSFISFVPWN
jgi:hypothetical protein